MAWGFDSGWRFRRYYQGFLRGGGPRRDSSRSGRGGVYWARDSVGWGWGVGWGGPLDPSITGLIEVVAMGGFDWLSRTGDRCEWVSTDRIRGDMYYLAHGTLLPYGPSNRLSNSWPHSYC